MDDKVYICTRCGDEWTATEILDYFSYDEDMFIACTSSGLCPDCYDEAENPTEYEMFA